MSALVIFFSLLIGYVFFMMSFYLLAKVLFPKMDQTPEEDSLMEKMDQRTQAARLSRAGNKTFVFNKRPQVA